MITPPAWRRSKWLVTLVLAALVIAGIWSFEPIALEAQEESATWGTHSLTGPTQVKPGKTVEYRYTGHGEPEGVFLWSEPVISRAGATTP